MRCTGRSARRLALTGRKTGWRGRCLVQIASGKHGVLAEDGTREVERYLSAVASWRDDGMRPQILIQRFMNGHRKNLHVMRATVPTDDIQGLAFALASRNGVARVLFGFATIDLYRHDPSSESGQRVEDDRHSRSSRSPSAVKLQRAFRIHHLQLV